MPAESEEAKVFDENFVDFNRGAEADRSSKKSADSPGTSYSCFSETDLPCQKTLTKKYCHSYPNCVKQTMATESVKDITMCSSGSVCLKMDSKVINFDSLEFGGQYVKKSIAELEAYSCNELKALLGGLSKTVEEISNQLVQLLLENDNLQQESDARNIAIEQLLKITVKVTETESKPVQMSVILSPEECEDI